uniref:Pituitary homeobox 2 n=1 Tax=Anthurium amnicola TaxID=1678845 RepID=A0A1D1Y6K4_9ARAE
MRTPGGCSPTILPSCTTSPAASPSPPSASFPRCHGLDLLAMAALEASGVGKEDEGSNNQEDSCKAGYNSKPAMAAKGDGGIGGVGFGEVPKKRGRQALMPSKYQDSVLQPWKRRSRQRRLPDAATRLG